MQESESLIYSVCALIQALNGMKNTRFESAAPPDCNVFQTLPQAAFMLIIDTKK